MEDTAEAVGSIALGARARDELLLLCRRSALTRAASSTCDIARCHASAPRLVAAIREQGFNLVPSLITSGAGTLPHTVAAEVARQAQSGSARAALAVEAILSNGDQLCAEAVLLAIAAARYVTVDPQLVAGAWSALSKQVLLEPGSAWQLEGVQVCVVRALLAAKPSAVPGVLELIPDETSRARAEILVERLECTLAEAS